MALKSSSPLNLAALRQDYSMLPKIAAVKAQANQQIISAIQSGLEKRKERIEKKEKNALNEKLLQDLIDSDPNNTIIPADVSSKELAKYITLEETMAHRRALETANKAAAKETQLIQAARSVAQKLGLPPGAAEANPRGVLEAGMKLQIERLKPKEPATPRIMDVGTPDGGSKLVQVFPSGEVRDLVQERVVKTTRGTDPRGFDVSFIHPASGLPVSTSTTESSILRPAPGRSSSPQVSKEDIDALAAQAANLTGQDKETFLALGRANPNSLATLVSNLASRKEDTGNLPGTAGQIAYAYELLASKNPTEIKQGELLLETIKNENLSPEEKAKSAYDIAMKTAMGKAAGEEEAGMQQARQAAARQIIVLENKINLAKDVLSSVTDDSLGLSQQILKFIPGTEQADFDANVETLKSFIALDGMLSLKKSSPTGSTGFGSLSEKELKTLQDRIRNLSSMQSPPQFRAALSEVIESFELSKSLLELEYLGWSDDEEVMAKRIKAVGLSKQAARAVYIAQGIMPPKIYNDGEEDFQSIFRRNFPSETSKK